MQSIVSGSESGPWELGVRGRAMQSINRKVKRTYGQRRMRGLRSSAEKLPGEDRGREPHVSEKLMISLAGEAQGKGRSAVATTSEIVKSAFEVTISAWFKGV